VCRGDADAKTVRGKRDPEILAQRGYVVLVPVMMEKVYISGGSVVHIDPDAGRSTSGLSILSLPILVVINLSLCHNTMDTLPWNCGMWPCVVYPCLVNMIVPLVVVVSVDDDVAACFAACVSRDSCT
jgi:hypothetical protein